jgi:hypothetical protein
MKKNEVVAKNINLTFDFLRNIIDSPDLLSNIPDGTEVDFLETDLPMPTSSTTVRKKAKRVMFKVEHTFHSVVADK